MSLDLHETLIVLQLLCLVKLSEGTHKLGDEIKENTFVIGIPPLLRFAPAVEELPDSLLIKSWIKLPSFDYLAYSVKQRRKGFSFEEVLN